MNIMAYMTKKLRKRRSKLCLLCEEYSYEITSMSAKTFWHQAEMLKTRYSDFDKFSTGEIAGALLDFYHVDNRVAA